MVLKEDPDAARDRHFAAHPEDRDANIVIFEFYDDEDGREGQDHHRLGHGARNLKGRRPTTPTRPRWRRIATMTGDLVIAGRAGWRLRCSPTNWRTRRASRACAACSKARCSIVAQTGRPNWPTLIREQAFGEALDPDKLERLGRYEVHLDRKLERMPTMLLRLKDLRRTAVEG